MFSLICQKRCVIISNGTFSEGHVSTCGIDNWLLSEVRSMKEGIHPNYGKAVVRCACGNTFETGSTKKELRVEICSQCHPFFTGKQKFVDTGGRVDRFKKKYGIE